MDSFEILDNAEKIEEIDRSGMLRVVGEMPGMLLDALEVSRKISLPKTSARGKKIRNIVISGMGGSAIAGNIVSDLLSKKVKAPIRVNRDYKIPGFVDSETLFFCPLLFRRYRGDLKRGKRSCPARSPDHLRDFRGKA